MKTRYLLGVMLTLCAFTLYGCGGGGGGGGSTVTTTLSGVVSKGLFVSGKVKVFGINADGTKGGAPLVTADINPDGTYTANIGGYVGPVVAEASGSYKDEATGSTMTVTESAPLRAALQKAEGDVKLTITALTEVAVKKVEDPASKKITVASIDATNKLVSDVFHVAGIVTTMPVDVSAAASAAATQEQKEYSLALAAVSQMMASSDYAGKSLDQVITEVKNSVTDSNTSLTTACAKDFQAALQTFVSDPNKNKTGITDATSTNLVNVGGSTATIKLKTVGSATNLNGIQATLTLPAGVTVKASGGIPLSGLVAASGVVSGGALFEAHYLPSATEPGKLIIALASKDSFAAGEYATIKCDVAPGVTINSSLFTASSFTNAKTVNGTGGIIQNITFAADVL